MKKLLTLLTILLTTLHVSAYDFVVNGIYYNVLSMQDLTCKVTYKDTNYNSYSGDIVIPTTVTVNNRTFKVTSIGLNAFNNCSRLSSVEIPNSITSIGNSAFSGCSGLTSVVIPNSVTYIDGKLFFNCYSLTSVVIPNSVTRIESSAFEGCSSLTSVVIPNSVTTRIASFAFFGCSSLRSVVISNSVTRIGIHAFSGCSNLRSVVIPNSVTKLEEYAFLGCTSLTSVVIGSAVREIYSQAFKNCSKLKEITLLTSTPPNAGTDAFEGVDKIYSNVYVPASSVDAYQSHAVWGKFWNIIGKEQCAKPVITISNGKVQATTATVGAKCDTYITSEDIKHYDGTESIELRGIYKITSCAHADGLLDSDTVTKMLYWSNPSLDGSAEPMLVGDINGDGVVDVLDVTTLIDMILNE